jgi:signal transduction histidine kinase
MNDRYKILFLEDNEEDVALMQSELSLVKMEFIARHVVTKSDFIHEVSEFQPDIILADYSLPSFNGMEAFRLARQINPGIPFILVTGALSEQLALEYLKEGIDDFIIKSGYKRLSLSIESAIRKKEIERTNQRIANELKKSHQELQLLLERQQISREDERMKIARDLHDELGQVLTTLKIDVSMLRKKVESNGAAQNDWVKQEFTAIIKLIDKITGSVKRIASGLRPEILDELGLIEAIRWHVTEFQKRHKIKCVLELPPNSLSLDNNSSIALFRIIQEALTNVTRHARATVVMVSMKIERNSLFLEIVDNGKGFTPESVKSSSALGIIGLRERVRLLHGKFTIMGNPGVGTTINVTVPFKKPLLAVL